MKRLLIFAITCVFVSLVCNNKTLAEPVQSDSNQDIDYGVVIVITKAPSKDIVVFAVNGNDTIMGQGVTPETQGINLQPGQYTVVSKCPGYKPVFVDSVKVEIASLEVLNMTIDTPEN